MNSTMYELDLYELENVSGGIAPILIGVGIAAGLGGGFAAGYGLARWLG
mgnify:CR=1 FL=1